MPGYTPPKKGLDPSPQTGNPFIGQRRGGADATSDGAEEVLDRNSGTIQAWLSAQRNAVANSITNIHRAVLDHPEIEATYQNHYGSETVTLSPKPQPKSVAAPAEPEPSSPPNDLVRLATQEVVTPQTPLYLMVLYGTDKIAAVPMDALALPSPVYAAKCSKTSWVDVPGSILRTFQLKVGKVGYVLLPVDLTGAIKRSNFMLSTTALGDAVQTPGEGDQVPLFNVSSDGKTVWTMCGSFVLVRGKLTLDTQVPFTPIAIQSDGTCHYRGGFAGSCSVAYDQSSATAASGKDQIRNLAQQKIQDEVDSLGSVTIHYAGMATASYGYEKNTQADRGIDYDDYQTYDYKNTVFAFKQVVRPTITATGFGVSGSYGSEPDITGFKAATGTQDYEDFKIASNNYGVVTSIGQFDFSGAFAIPSFKLGDTLSVALYQVKASQANNDTLTLASGATQNACGAATFASGRHSTPGANLESYTLETFSIGGFDPNNHVPTGPVNDLGSYEGRYAELVAAVMSSGLVDGSAVHTMVQLVTDVGQKGVQPYGSASGQYSYSSGSGGESGSLHSSPTPNDIAVAGYAIGFGDTSQQQTVYSDLHTPQIGKYEAGGSDLCTIEFFGQTLAGSSATQDYSDILVHNTPPMLGTTKPFYTLFDAQEHATVVTPYGSFDGGSNAEAFTSWLHVSNGDHVIQGFRVNGMPYAFLDGGSKDWLALLCKALKCDRTDIVTMVMDVTLQKIKAVAGVTGSGYAAAG